MPVNNGIYSTEQKEIRSMSKLCLFVTGQNSLSMM